MYGLNRASRAFYSAESNACYFPKACKPVAIMLSSLGGSWRDDSVKNKIDDESCSIVQ